MGSWRNSLAKLFFLAQYVTITGAVEPTNQPEVDPCHSSYANAGKTETEGEAIPRKIERMDIRLAKIHGTAVVRDAAEAEQRGMSAHYNRHDRTITINPDVHIDLYIQLHHESVHSTTDRRIRTDPANKENALAIEIKREGGVIDPGLPSKYQNYFRIDEMKAYRKTSALISQVAKQRRKTGDSLLEITEEAEKDARAKSISFARATTKILDQTIKAIAQAMRGKKLEMNAFLYLKDVKDVYVVHLSLEQESGPPILVKIPLYDTDVKDGVIENLYGKLLDVCLIAREQAKKYDDSNG